MMYANPTGNTTSELHAWLPQEVREELSAFEQQAVVPAGTQLITQNVSPTHLVILKSGTAEISLQAKGGFVPLGIAGPGSVFDLRAMVCGALPCVEVVCREQCTVTLIPREDFNRLLKRRPRAYFAVAKVLSSDLRTADEALRRVLSAPMRSNRRVRPNAFHSSSMNAH
jgi:CRP-like cAMP-binding protein